MRIRLPGSIRNAKERMFTIAVMYPHRFLFYEKKSMRHANCIHGSFSILYTCERRMSKGKLGQHRLIICKSPTPGDS